MHALDGTHAPVGVRIVVPENKGRLVRSRVKFFGEPAQLLVTQDSLSSRIQEYEVCMRQFNHARLNAHLLLLQKREQFPQLLAIVVIADRHVNGDARSADWLNKPEQHFVLGFRSSAHGAVAIDDQVRRPGIEGDYVLGHVGKALRHVYALMLGFLDGRARPLRSGVNTIGI